MLKYTMHSYVGVVFHHTLSGFCFQMGAHSLFKATLAPNLPFLSSSYSFPRGLSLLFHLSSSLGFFASLHMSRTGNSLKTGKYQFPNFSRHSNIAAWEKSPQEPCWCRNPPRHCPKNTHPPIPDMNCSQ